MAKTFICSCCHRKMPINPRIKDQRFCSNVVCQRDRKRRWQQAKMASDPDYRANQQDAYRAWCEQNPEYWRRRRQGKENALANSPPARPDKSPAAIVKMDALAANSPLFSGQYLLTPIHPAARKMDALMVKIVPISVP
jgi:hypothetical protein